MLRIGIAFLTGVCCVHALSSLPAWWICLGALAIGLSVARLVRSVLLAALLLGFGWAWSHAQLRLADDLPAELEGRDVLVRGRIASIPDSRDLDPQFELDVERGDDPRVPSRLRLTWYDADLRLRAGEQWQLVVRLKRRSGFANPGGFDYEAYLFREGIGATGYVRSDERNAKLADPGAKEAVLRTRAWLAERIALAVGGSTMLGILTGLAVGDTQSMTPEQWRVFAATGTSHLMAISGLHISMVAALAALLGGAIVRWPGAQSARLTAIHGQALAGMSAALCYSLLAGMSVPTQRTLAMLCIYFVARVCRRTLSVGNALGLSLIGVLLIDPFAPLSVGAWLSFVAVGVIVLATAGRLRAANAVVNFARVQWSVTIGLLPILIIAFGSVSLIAPVANALAVPLFTLIIVPLTLAGTALATVSIEIGGWLLHASAQLLEWCWPVLRWLAEQPLALWYMPELPVTHLAMLALGALLLVLPGTLPLRFTAVALCLPAALFEPPTPERGGYELAMLDVGQGLAVVVRTHSHVLVYDTGPAFRTGRDAGELVVLPYLRSRGVHAIDGLVISHGDLDHAGGMKTLLAGMRTRSVLAGASVDAPVGVERCAEGQRWQWDGVMFELLHPEPERPSGSDNDGSCVLKVTGAGGTALLTGDIEAQAEADIVARTGVAADIVTVAHHGSRSSSTPAFVSATQAKLALVSAGYRNRWNFPRPEIVHRWRDAGAEFLSTIDSGAIHIEVPPHRGISVRHFRRERHRYWSAR
jgi:competence protein ComEC